MLSAWLAASSSSSLSSITPKRPSLVYATSSHQLAYLTLDTRLAYLFALGYPGANFGDLHYLKLELSVPDSDAPNPPFLIRS